MTTDILASLNRITSVANLLDIALVSLVFYGLLRLFRGTQAVQLLRGVLVIALAAAVMSQAVQLTAFNWLLRNSTPFILVAIPVIFQPELRRALERVGRSTPFLTRRLENTTTQNVINQVIKAVEQLSQRRHGALIVFEKSTGLSDITDLGVQLNAEVSAEALTTIFFPNTALHDGAVVIRDDRILAAGCVLPLTQRILPDHQMGTRHRAAIGVTEQTDALTIVISEETGNVSVARNGRIARTELNLARSILSDFYRG
ncbi:MAG: diadenylate cyclase CdaA [Caldilineaceae bacterium]|nr:diadenylate cyclase CdaA [Caldilineaceae bacterium]